MYWAAPKPRMGMKIKLSRISQIAKPIPLPKLTATLYQTTQAMTMLTIGISSRRIHHQGLQKIVLGARASRPSPVVDGDGRDDSVEKCALNTIYSGDGDAPNAIYSGTGD